jgi:hypothetical protein
VSRVLRIPIRSRFYQIAPLGIIGFENFINVHCICISLKHFNIEDDISEKKNYDNGLSPKK